MNSSKNQEEQNNTVLMTLFGKFSMQVEVPKGYEPIVARGLKLTFNKGWISSPKKTAKNTFQPTMGEKKEVF